MTEAKRNAFRQRARSILAGLLAAASQSAWSEEPAGVYVMTVIADEAQGEQVITGEYAEAIAAITSSPKQPGSDFAVSNNLCVAFTKTNDLRRAGEACAEALKLSRATFGPSYEAFRTRSDRAVALSNRGVIRAITGDSAGARSDFESARRLNEGLTAAADNLTRLETGRAPVRTVSSL